MMKIGQINIAGANGDAEAGKARDIVAQRTAEFAGSMVGRSSLPR